MKLRTLATALAVAVATLAPALAISEPAGAQPAGTADPSRATWVWGRPDVADLTSFAAGEGVDDLFVAVYGAPDSDELGWLTRLRRASDDAGIRLQALGDEPAWLRRPGAAVTWARDVAATGLFTGLHVDVEPWGSPGWNRHRAKLLKGYLTLLDRISRATKLPVEADIAFWLGDVRFGGHRLDRLVLDRVDAVTVMTYRHKVRGRDSVTSLGRRTLRLAGRLGKPVRLAVETNHLGDGPIAQKQTFYGRPQAALARALAVVDDVEARAAAYRGMAVHDSEGWAALAR